MLTLPAVIFLQALVVIKANMITEAESQIEQDVVLAVRVVLVYIKAT